MTGAVSAEVPLPSTGPRGRHVLAMVVVASVALHAQPPAPADPVAEIAQWLTGRYSNEAQAPLKGVSPGGGSKQAQDQVHVHVQPTVAPVLPGRVLYVQWNRDADEGPIARQRLWALRATGDGAVSVSVAAFAEPETFADALTNLRALATIGADDLVSMPEDCAIVLTRQDGAWSGTTSPRCTITEKSGRSLTFQARLRVGPAGFTYQERSFAGPEFTPVLSLPKTGSYDFRKLQ